MVYTVRLWYSPDGYNTNTIDIQVLASDDRQAWANAADKFRRETGETATRCEVVDRR